MAKKQRIDMTIDQSLVNYMDSHFQIPGTKWSRSKFIESIIREKIKGTMKPEDLLKNEIRFHEEKRKFHDDILAELYIKEKRLKGDLKLVPATTLKEMRKNSDIIKSQKQEKEQDIKVIIGPVQNQAVVTQNLNKTEIQMREKALEIING